MKKFSLSISFLAATLAFACSDDSDSSPEASGGDLDASTQQEVIETYAKIVSAGYQDSLSSAEELDAAIESFLAEPSEAGMTAAREAWLAAREPYLQTEVFRFYGGPIDNDADGPEGMLNAWPLDENYIDYVDGDESTGIINDDSQEISAEALAELNEVGSESNIATGYHAIEFLLWGQDRSVDGPGERAFTDYVTGDEGTAANQERRGEYLNVVSDLLVEQLGDLKTAWAEGETNYRSSFEAEDFDAALTKILTGMTVLSGFETGGERLQAALDSGDQEDEHSCFSDNTHRDMIQDIQGVLNVWLGTYTDLEGNTISGAGIQAVVENLDPELAKELEAQIRNSLKLANELETPFDQAIDTENESGRQGVSDLVASLMKQRDLLEDVFRELELSVPNPE